MLTSDDPNPPHICNLPIDNLISLYYVLWIILVRLDFSLHNTQLTLDSLITFLQVLLCELPIEESFFVVIYLRKSYTGVPP